MDRVTALGLLATILSLAQCSRSEESPADVPPNAPSEVFFIERIPTTRRLLPVQAAGVDQRGSPQYLIDVESDAVFSISLAEPVSVAFVHDPGGVPDGSGGRGWVEFRQRPTACGDLDGDGRMDLAYASYGDCKVVLLLGDDGGLRPAGTLSYDGQIGSIDISSLNGKGGRQSLIVANYANKKSVRLYRWDDAVGLVESTRVALQHHSKPRDIAVVDANQDGLPDLVTLDARRVDLQLYAQRPSGEFARVPDFFEGELGAYVTESCVADIDGDGTDDLIALSWFSPVSVVLSSSPGRVMNWSRGLVGPVTSYDVEAVVLDAVGSYEILLPNMDRGSLVVLAGQGQGVPVFTEVYDVCSVAAAVAVSWPVGEGAPVYLVSSGVDPELAILRRR